MDRNCLSCSRISSLGCRTPQGCVDRNTKAETEKRALSVAPSRGAWIEITAHTASTTALLRRTPQGCVDRNSKVSIHDILRNGRTPQGCVDRNHHEPPGANKSDVAPRRGAWIEIGAVTPALTIPWVAPRRGAWIEILRLSKQVHSRKRRTPQGCVDRNSRQFTSRYGIIRRTPQGCVDRNSEEYVQHRTPKVAPRRGAWIEILDTNQEGVQ